MSDEQNILIVENLELKGEWTQKFSPSQEIEIDDILALFQGKTVHCTVITPFEERKVRLKSGARTPTGILQASKEFEIRLWSESAIHVDLVSVFGTGALGDLHLMGIPIDIDEVKVTNKPEMGWQIAFDFGKAIKVLGAKEKSKEVQIKNANATWKIIHSSANFQWRGNKLVCRMPIGEYKIRMRLKNGNWSEWRPFKCKRRYWL